MMMMIDWINVSGERQEGGMVGVEDGGTHSGIGRSIDKLAKLFSNTVASHESL